MTDPTRKTDPDAPQPPAAPQPVAKTGELIEHLQKTGRLAPCFSLPAPDAARELTRNA